MCASFNLVLVEVDHLDTIAELCSLGVLLHGPPSVYDQYLTAIIVKENLSYRAVGASGPLRGDRV